MNHAARTARLAVLLPLLALATPAAGAAFPPHLRFCSISGARVTVHYHQGLEAMARQAVALATEILERHEARYRHRVGHLHIVLADVDDDPNGYSTPFPYPLVNIRAASPDGSDEFGNFTGWLRYVLTHELAHSVHLDEGRGIVRVGRKVFGRAPYLFPNLFAPTWMIEGLATYEETEGTAFGRGRNPDARMVLRMAALEGAFLREDQAVLAQDRWPQGQASYLFGEAFLREMTARSGPSTLPELARVQAGHVIPYLDDLTSIQVTGTSFHAHWQEWSAEERSRAQREAEQIQAAGLTPSCALTTRGIRQTEPRFSPDGAWIAYSSETLTRFPAIRLMRPDGSGDRRLADRNGGTSLSWTPDGRALVYDEPDLFHAFSHFSDLRTVELASGRVRWLTRGLRARDPDVAPDGGSIVFVRRLGDRSDLYTIGLDGHGLRRLTNSAPGTQWSGPHWRPQGDVIAASRWTAGGWLDLVEVDPATGAATNLTEDRAKDVEPTWTPDGEHLIFRSDRDGVSNLYALRREDRALLRVTNVEGGAFSPSVSPNGSEVAFAAYSSRGYDVHLAPLDLARAPHAEPFHDPYPTPGPDPEPETAAARTYNPFTTLLPRFWTPLLRSADRETLYGAATAGADPLFRHVWGLDVYRGTASGRFSSQGFYQYDRLWPTFLLTLEDEKDLVSQGILRTRRLNLQASVPLWRSVRSSQTFSLTWRRERQEAEGSTGSPLDLGGVEAAWTLSTAKQYPLSISPLDGYRLRLAYLKEDPSLGSSLSLGKVSVDARAYLRLFGESDVLALRTGGGFTVGQPGFQRSFAVGGFPDSDLFDLVKTNMAVLRGYPDNAFPGRSFAEANLEYRVPLAALERGERSLPLFVRHLHTTAFFDAAHAWSGVFRLGDVKTAAGISLGADTYVGHRLPLTGQVSLARGFAPGGDTRVYFRLGLAF
jgi:Tol biopolymer transport system component